MTSAYSLAVSPDFPKSRPVREPLRYLLRYAILAPSFRNAQPWRFRLSERWVDILVDEAGAAPMADPVGRELAMGLGACADHLALAMRRHGMDALVLYSPDPERPEALVRVECKGDYDPSFLDIALFNAVEHRHTAETFDGTDPLPAARLTELEAAAAERSVGLFWVRHGEMRQIVADLVERADRVLFEGKRYREELAEWTRADWSAYGDGVPAEALGVSGLVRRVFPWLVAHLDLGGVVAEEERIRALSAPALAVLSTKGDTVNDWLDAGQALSRVLLQAATADLRGAFLNGPLEAPGIRERLRAEMAIGGYPQALLRLGPGPEGRPTPRRPLESFVVDE